MTSQSQRPLGWPGILHLGLVQAALGLVGVLAASVTAAMATHPAGGGVPTSAAFFLAAAVLAAGIHRPRLSNNLAATAFSCAEAAATETGITS